MGRKRTDLTGRRFGRLEVLSFSGQQKSNRRWLCRCDCGREVAVWQANLISGRTRSCGCMQTVPGDCHYIGGTCVEVISSKRVSRANSSGVRGVYWNARRGKWSAQITFQGKTRYLGLYPTLEEAAAARAQAEKRYFEPFLQQYEAAKGTAQTE